jgi:monofunctional biosynthetic peptidoglycan transglycosylase
MRRRLLRLSLIAAVVLVGLAVWVGLGLPDRSAVASLAHRNPERTRLMDQREEEARRAGRHARRLQTWVPLSAISRYLLQAVLSSEDQRFFGHEGVDWNAVQTSLGKDLEKRRFVRGGSTITQQLAKNLYFGTGKTPIRKLRELVVARWLEADLSKQRILTLYLNVIEWGDGIYGAEAAAQHWFSKPASALSPTEAAGLAAMIPNPRRLNPRVAPLRYQRATRRVLWLMARAGYLGRDVAGMGAEPPPEPVEEDEEEPTDGEPGWEPSSQPSPQPSLEPSLQRSPQPSAQPSPQPPPASTPPPGAAPVVPSGG